ncbi:MAG: hypothetical protein ACT4P9_13095 [Betaproteobacteria bacterium]
MSWLLGAVGIVLCLGFALVGYWKSLLIGGIVGSFFGIAGFGGAVSGAIPGAIVAAVIAIALEKNDKPT